MTAPSARLRADIRAEADECEWWMCPECGETCDLHYDGNEPLKRCQECDFYEYLDNEQECYP